METRAEEIARLQREIGERQARLAYLVLGDQSECVTCRFIDGYFTQEYARGNRP